MNEIVEQREWLMDAIRDKLGTSCTVVSYDAADVRPLPNQVAVLIQPPGISFDTWSVRDIYWTVVICAGTMGTQTLQLDLLTDAVMALDSVLNISSAEAVTYQQPNGGALAAYQVKLNPFDNLKIEVE
jgi:hypothetical protein